LISQKVDPETLEPLADEQRIARQQLRQVLNYAETVECRRAVQLRYFGEVVKGNCAGCDNCTEPRDVVDVTKDAQQFLSCIARLAQRRERFGAAYLIEVLRGGESQKLIDRGHQSLSVYGIGKGRSVDEWRDLARTLLHQGLVRESQDGYPVLSLNDASWEVLRGQRAVTTKALRAGKKKKSLAPDAATPDEKLFESLRVVRKRLAVDAGVPPYVIFHDASLREMAARKPTSLDAFATIPGVGQAKLQRYGDAFIAAINEAAR
jgi:ATP-dependent DNA helicase RecQ